MKCHKCESKMEPATKIINYKGRSVMVNILKCVKCNHTLTHINEVERARLILNPTFTEKIKAKLIFL